MKVLHIIPRIVPTKDGVFVGGSVNALFNLIDATSSKVDSIIYTHTDNGFKKLFYKLKNNKDNIIIDENTMPPGSILYGLYFMIKGLITLINNRVWGADIIHGHSGFSLYGLFFAIAGKIMNKPVVYSLYCPIYINKPNSFIGYIKKKINYLALIFTNKIMAMSYNIVNSIRCIGIPQDNILIIPPYINIDKYSPHRHSMAKRNEMGAKEDEPIILFVGNLKYSKGIDLLVEALGLLIKDISFRFVYTLELKDKAFESILQKISHKMTITGLSDYTTQLGIINSMPDLMASADLIVFPYRNTDGPSDYPIALLEAMASGIPAVGTLVGGIPELIEDGVTGILVEPDNAQGLALAIRTLIDNPDYRKKMGQNARAKCRQMFNSQNIINLHTNLYNELLKTKGDY
jgi:glycosyltransferase involved in cell wall biosynthesis